MRVVVSVLAVSLALSGCMPSTVGQLREGGARDEFVTGTPYQKVYRNILTMMRECAFGGFLFASSEVEGQLYTDLEAAEVLVTHNNMGDVSILFHSEISSVEGGTRVETYVPDIGMHPDKLPRVRRWADGEGMTCDTADDAGDRVTREQSDNS